MPKPPTLGLQGHSRTHCGSEGLLEPRLKAPRNHQKVNFCALWGPKGLLWVPKGLPGLQKQTESGVFAQLESLKRFKCRSLFL